MKTAAARVWDAPSFELGRKGDARRVAITRYLGHDLDGSRSIGLVGVVAPGRMSTDSHTENVAALSDSDLDSLLGRLVSEEQVTSKRRETLHNRIEFVAAGGGAASAEQAADQLASLRESERQVSDRRLILHRRIDELRAERSRRQALGVRA